MGFIELRIYTGLIPRKVWLSEFENAAFCKIYFRTDEMPHMPKYEPTLISYDDAKLEMPWGIGVETSIWP